VSPIARRLAVIGLDSADLSLIERWSDMDMLPAFARLRREGTWIKLKNRGEFPSMTIWPSICTGTHLGKNGIYFPVQIGRGKAKLELVKPEQCGQRPFWAHFAAGGKRSIVVDVPFTYPIRGLDGLQIANWGSYERYAPPVSEPPHEIRAIQKRFGRYPFGEELSRNAPISDRDFRRVRRKLLSGVPRKGEMIRHLMRGQAWDFFMGVFAETHPAGHYFWDGHDSSSPQKLCSEFRSTLLDVYQRLDNEIGKIAATLDGRTTLLIVSGHGMGPNHSGWHLIPEVLQRIGVNPSSGKGGDEGKKTWLLRLRESIPRNWRDLVSHSLPNQLRDYLRIHWANAKIDWLNDLVFSLPTDAHGLIRVNLKGREASGKVNSGAEYEEICQKVSRALKDLVDAQTGKPIVAEVFLTDEIFAGSERDRLPDLIVSWKNGKQIDRVASKEVGNISGKLPDPRSGNHRAEGFALLYGPDIAKRQRTEGHLLDIAPTILSFYGQAVPGSFDGRPWNDIVC
jgi:predicted AlkP superfamily phosphohydrolase/phosphomutase